MQKSQIPSKRTEWIDSVAGLLIIHMIFIHCLQWSKYENTILDEITQWLFFFMPWFFFKAGVFYKRREFKPYVKKQVHKLLAPYIFFSFIGYVINLLITVFNGDISMASTIRPIGKFLTVGATDGNLALWFLLSLFGVQVLYNLFDTKYSGQNKNYILIAILIILSTLLNIVGFSKPYYVTNIIAGLIFFVAGRILKEFQYKNIVAITCFVLFISIMIIDRSIVGMWSNTLISGHYLLWIVCSICGCISIDNIFKLFGGGNISFLRKIGTHSMNYYVTHWMVIEVIFFIMEYLTTNNLYILLVLVITNIFLLPILNVVITKYDLISKISNAKYEEYFNRNMGRKC